MGKKIRPSRFSNFSIAKGVALIVSSLTCRNPLYVLQILFKHRNSDCAAPSLPVFLFQNQNGMTVVEVMSAILIFAIIMVGGLNYFFLPQAIIARQKMKRLAIVDARQKMESIAALNYDQVTSALNESGVPVTLGTITGTRNTTITEIDDPADGLDTNDADGVVVDYKNITVQISWNDGNNQQI